MYGFDFSKIENLIKDSAAEILEHLFVTQSHELLMTLGSNRLSGITGAMYNVIVVV